MFLFKIKGGRHTSLGSEAQGEKITFYTFGKYNLNYLQPPYEDIFEMVGLSLMHFVFAHYCSVP